MRAAHDLDQSCTNATPGANLGNPDSWFLFAIDRFCRAVDFWYHVSLRSKDGLLVQDFRHFVLLI